MGKVKDTYDINVNIEGLSLFNANQIYERMAALVPNEMRESVSVVLVDPAGGKHYDNHTGQAPDSEYVCKNCFNLNCVGCKRYSDGENSSNE